MLRIRLSEPADIPALRGLWALAFGDSDSYLDNFFHTYYRPERMLVLEEDGTVRAMTAWFDTSFVVPGRGAYRAAYLYAVATHPDCRGRGLAARLLAGADDYFRGLSIPAVTTVPAEPSLHTFFGSNGFRECFTLAQKELRAEELTRGDGRQTLRPASPAEYGAARERLLADLPHIAYPEDALNYQAGCCRVSGGGLFQGDTPKGAVCLCAEGAGGGRMVIKEFLGAPAARRLALQALPQIVPARRWLIRVPQADGLEEDFDFGRFAMLKWTDPALDAGWDWRSAAYLGLAFD